MIGKTFKATKLYPYTTKGGEKLVQKDTFIAKVTWADERRFEYETVERINCENKAPFDNGGSTGGGYSFDGVKFFERKNEFEWI